MEISETFMETRDAADGWHLYDRESGGELVIPEEAKEYGMHLGINCISGGEYVFGRNLEEVRHLSQEEGVLQEWYDGTFFVRMNAIEGFISGSDGHWIAKRYRVKELETRHKTMGTGSVVHPRNLSPWFTHPRNLSPWFISPWFITRITFFRRIKI